MPRKSKKPTTPTSDSINDGTHGQVPMEEKQEVRMNDKAVELGISLTTDEELSAITGSIGKERFQPFWKEVFEVSTFPDGAEGEETNYVQFTVDPEHFKTFKLWSEHAYPTCTIGKMFLNDLRFGAYEDIAQKNVIFKTKPETAAARGNQSNFAYMRFDHSGDFGQYGVVKPPPSGWRALSVGTAGTFVGSMVVDDQSIVDYWNGNSPWFGTKLEGMWVASYYRMEALFVLLSGYNVRIKLGPQSRAAVLSRLAVWNTDDLEKARELSNTIDWAGRERRRQYKSVGQKAAVLKNGGSVAPPVIPDENGNETQYSNEEGILTVMSSNGIALKVGSIPFPTRIKVTRNDNNAVVYDELTLGENPNTDFFQLGSIIENMFEIEVLD